MNNNPTLESSFANSGQKESIPSILKSYGWTPTNPNIHGYQLNELFHQIYSYLNHVKKKGFSFWEFDIDYVSNENDIDIVRRNNKIYFCKKSNSNRPPETNPDYWTLFYDLDNPLTDKKSQVVEAVSSVSCLSASPLLDGEKWQPSDVNTTGVITPLGNGGVLVSGGAGATLELVLPYMVVIGDSISEGHPELHGRLHTSYETGEIDLDFKSQKGQLSYEFSKKYNIPVINQGIGGQTSTDIKNRWGRDILGITHDIGDGRGSSTLNLGGQKPFSIYLHVGVNDVMQGVSEDTMKTNFNFFAQSCRDNNIKLLVANIGANSVYTETQENLARAINIWLETEFKDSFQEVEIIDYLDWSSDATKNYKQLKTGMFADTVHPNKIGYADYAEYIFKNIDIPLSLVRVELSSIISGPANFQRITKFKFNGDEYSINNIDISSIGLNPLVDIDSPNYTLEVLECIPITGNLYTGFSELKAYFERNFSSFIPPRVDISKQDVVACGVIISGLISSSWKYFGIESIDDIDLATLGRLKITFSKPVTHLVLNMVGVSDNSFEFTPTWSTPVPTTEGRKEWYVNLKRITDGAEALSSAYHNYQFIAYSY